MLTYEISFDDNTTTKDILEELADDHNKSLEKLKDVPELEWDYHLGFNYFFVKYL